MSSPIIDIYGNPITTRLLNGAESNSSARPAMRTRVESIKEAVPMTDWKVILSVSRRLFANNGIIQGALSQKAMHAVGCAWNPVFLGADREWGKEATRWLEEEWFPTCNVRGEVYDFRTMIYLSSINIDRDGDEAEILTETQDGYPQIQTIAADRIGNRGSYDSKVQSGPYKGMNIAMGCITNELGRTVAYRVLAENPEDDRDVSARDIVFNFDPLYADQLRGFPIFSHALNDWRDADQSQYWEQLAQLIASSIGIIEQNETGSADTSDPSFTLGGVSDQIRETSTETMMGGMVRYFKAGTGSKLESFQSNRPGDVWDSFQDRIARKALGPVWPYSLCWKPDGMNGTQERSTIENARNLIEDRQELLKPRARRKVGYAISKAIKLGLIPPYTGADKGGFLKWGFTMPAKFSIDHGREDQQWRENYKIGAENLSSYLERSGGMTFEQHQTQRTDELADIIARAQELSDRTAVPFDTCLSLFTQRTSVGNVPGGRFGSELPMTDEPAPV